MECLRNRLFFSELQWEAKEKNHNLWENAILVHEKLKTTLRSAGYQARAAQNRQLLACHS
jgi:hypothetical protein